MIRSMAWCVAAGLGSVGWAQGTDPFGPGAKDVKLLVIGASRFGEAGAALVKHKSATGMPAQFVAIEALHTLVEGKDEPERIKRMIAAGVKLHGVRYVMLVGDASMCPVRFRRVTQVPADAAIDGTYNPSELYYSNLFRKHVPGAGEKAGDPGAITSAGEFETWDASGDGVFNEQHWAPDASTFNPDGVDGCPDVAVGRVPAHTELEFAVYVQKVITYERMAAIDPRNVGAEARREATTLGGRMMFIADRNYSGSTGSCDALLAAAVKAGMPPATMPSKFEFIPGVTVKAPEGQGPPAGWEIGTFAAVDQVVQRSSWVTYFGHAMPTAWAISDGEGWYDMARIRGLKREPGSARGERVIMPIVVTIGCESGRFAQWQPSAAYRDMNGVKRQFIRNDEEKMWYEMGDKTGGVMEKVGARLVVPQPAGLDLPENRDLTMACAWLFGSAVADKNGKLVGEMENAGAIAFFGESLVCENDKGFELVSDMFERYGAGDRVLGDLWVGAQRTYWLKNRASEDVFKHPRIYLGMMNFFGDPSLRLGGVK